MCDWWPGSYPTGPQNNRHRCRCWRVGPPIVQWSPGFLQNWLWPWPPVARILASRNTRNAVETFPFLWVDSTTDTPRPACPTVDSWSPSWKTAARYVSTDLKSTYSLAICWIIIVKQVNKCKILPSMCLEANGSILGNCSVWALA